MQSKRTRSGFLGVSIPAALIISLSFTACVSLKTPVRADLVPLNAPMSIGKYPVRVNRTVSNSASSKSQDTIISTVIWYYFKNSPGNDSLELSKATHFELNLTDEKHATAILYNGKVPLKTDINKGRLRKGYFRLKHDLSFSGIPPFYWSMSSSKKQFGIGKEGQLFIDAADETNGSILIMMAGTPGFTRSMTVPIYEKP
jgi:hypothetical protein